MPTITEAHVVQIKNQSQAAAQATNDNDLTPWEEFLVQHRKIKPERFQVHLVVSGFGEREDARGFAENFMAYGSLFVFNNNKRPVFRLDVESENSGQ